MSNLNQVILQGNLVKDPEIVGAEQNVARFTIAVNSGYGEHKSTAFVDCVAFGKQVETIKKFFTKGKQVIIRGSLTQNKWEDKEGNTRSKIEVRLETFEGFFFAGNAGGGGGIDVGSKRESEEPAIAAANSDGKLF